MILDVHAGDNVMTILREIWPGQNATTTTATSPATTQRWTGFRFVEVAFGETEISTVIDVLLHANPHQTWDLEFIHCRGQVSILLSTAMTMDAVRRLRFQGDLDRHSAAALGTSLRYNKSLVAIRFDGCGCLAGKDMGDIVVDGLSHNQHVEELKMASSAFTEDAVSRLSQGLRMNHHLRCISLHACRLSDEQVANVLYSLEHNHSLQELDLGYNQCGTASLAAMALLLQHEETKLAKLSLEYQRGVGVGDGGGGDGSAFLESLSRLVTVLRSNQTLTHLDLSGNHLQNQDMTLLASLLLANSTLETLHLWDNDISDEGAKAFARQMPKMGGLKKLYLGDNHFGPEGTNELLEALNLNNHIQFLGFPHFTWVRQMAI
jgi:hypothetical protein